MKPGAWSGLWNIEINECGKDEVMVYITGDTHGRFERVTAFCRRVQTSPDDILIILGDAGINFSGAEYPSLLFAKDGEIFDLDGK